MSADPVAPAAPGAPAIVTSDAALTREHGLRLLHEMLRIRRFEEKCAELYSAGKIRGFLHLYIGEEAIAAGLIQPESFDAGVHDLHRTTEADGVFCYTFFKGVGEKRGDA